VAIPNSSAEANKGKAIAIAETIKGRAPALLMATSPNALPDAGITETRFMTVGFKHNIYVIYRVGTGHHRRIDRVALAKMQFDRGDMKVCQRDRRANRYAI
jgi:hypothetical protein